MLKLFVHNSLLSKLTILFSSDFVNVKSSELYRNLDVT